MRDPKIKGDTATEYETDGHFLVLCEGDFDQETVSPEQLEGAALACAWGATQFGLPTTTIKGHRDYASTACPGSSLYSHLESGQLKSRVDELVQGGGVDLEVVCGPDADAIVADIEAGRQ